MDQNKTQQPKTSNKVFNTNFIILFIANMLLNMGNMMSNSILSLYASSLGAPAAQIGTLMSMFAITALAFRFIAGPAINAFNPKLLAGCAIGLMGVSYLGYGIAPWLSSVTGLQIITVLKLFRLLQGIGNAFANSGCLTMASEVLPRERFSYGIGIYSCAQVIAQAIGPIVGVSLRDAFGYNMVYILFFAIMAMSVLALCFLYLPYYKTARFEIKFNSVIAPEAIVPAFLNFLMSMGFTAINAFLLVYSEARGIANASLFFTAYAMVMIAGRPIIGKISERVGFVKTAIPSILLTTLSLVMIGYARNLPVLLFAGVINGLGYGTIQPAVQSLCMKSVPFQRRGSASSTNYIGLDLATLISPVLFGLVANQFGYVPQAWLLIAVPVLAAAVVVLLASKRICRIEAIFQNTNEAA